MDKQVGSTRQRVNYHLRELERAGLVEVVTTRQRRGFVERVVVARADRRVIDPDMMAGNDPTTDVDQDRFAEPADVHRFTDDVAEQVGRLVETYNTTDGRR